MRIRILGSLPFAAVLAVPAAAGDVAVIVNPQNQLSTVSSNELSRIFRLDQQHWTGGQKIELILQESGSAKEQVILERVYGMKQQGELKQFWLGKVFRGELTSAPRAFASDDSVKRYVSSTIAAVGFIDSALVDGSVKTLRIDGKAPGEAGYTLARH